MYKNILTLHFISYDLILKLDFCSFHLLWHYSNLLQGDTVLTLWVSTVMIQNKHVVRFREKQLQTSETSKMKKKK